MCLLCYNQGKILSVTNYTDANIGNINPFRYKSYYYDTETGLYYLQTRYYDPEVGRFINSDSVAYLGKGKELINYNLFAYCSNNPVNRVDYMGTKVDDPTDNDDDNDGNRDNSTQSDEECNPAGSNVNGNNNVFSTIASWFSKGKSSTSSGTTTNNSTSTTNVSSTNECGKDTASTTGAVQQVSKPIHGNSKASTKTNHGYEIYVSDPNHPNYGNVVKTGISSQPLNKNGSSPRANRQVNAFNRAEGNIYSARVVETNLPGRQAALEWEQANTNRLDQEGHNMWHHVLPKPNWRK